VFAGIEEGKDKHDTPVKELEGKFLLESKTEVQKQQINIAEGDVFKDIRDVWVVVESSQQLQGEGTKLK